MDPSSLCASYLIAADSSQMRSGRQHPSPDTIARDVGGDVILMGPRPPVQRGLTELYHRLVLTRFLAFSGVGEEERAVGLALSDIIYSN